MRALSSSISAFRDLAHSLSESGRTISSDGERGERVGWSGWRSGPKCCSLPSVVLSCLIPVRCEVRAPFGAPPMFEQRVLLISLISFPVPPDRQTSAPLFPSTPFFIPVASSVTCSPHSFMPPQCDAPRHFESENGVRTREMSRLRRSVIRCLPASTGLVMRA